MAITAELRGAAIGAVTFVVTQLFLPSTASTPGWFLNSGTTIQVTLVAVGLAAILVELIGRSHSPWRPLCMAAGMWTAMVLYLFVIGPGNLFPMVIVMGSFFLVPTVVIAGYIGMMVRVFARRD